MSFQAQPIWEIPGKGVLNWHGPPQDSKGLLQLRSGDMEDDAIPKGQIGQLGQACIGKDTVTFATVLLILEQIIGAKPGSPRTLQRRDQQRINELKALISLKPKTWVKDRTD